MKSAQQIESTDILNNNVLVNFVRESGATESKPIVLGNVEFWMDEPAKWNNFTPQMCFSLPLSRWNTAAIKTDLTAKLQPIYSQMTPSEQNKLHYTYAQVMSLIKMREDGQQLPEDVSSLDVLKDELASIDVMFREPNQTVIKYSPELNIKNTKMLAPGLGLNYLACITSHIAGEYIAKKWYRDFPADEQVVIVFGGR